MVRRIRSLISESRIDSLRGLSVSRAISSLAQQFEALRFAFFGFWYRQRSICEGQPG